MISGLRCRDRYRLCWLTRSGPRATGGPSRFWAGSAHREAYAALLGALDDSSSAIRAQAADALVAAGKPAIALVHPKLNSAESAPAHDGCRDPESRRSKAIAPWSNLRSRTIYCRSTETTSLVERWHRAEGIPSLALLRTALREQERESARWHLLPAGGASRPNATVLVIEDSFHSEVDRVRANVAEALEAMTTPRVAGLVAPLFEPKDNRRNGSPFFGQDAWGMTFPDPPQAMHHLLVDHDDAWLRSSRCLQPRRNETLQCPVQRFACRMGQIDYWKWRRPSL